MNLANKNVSVVYMSVDSFPNKTTVKVNISEQIAEGVFKQLDTYDLTFDKLYQSPSDPALISAIYEKLSALP